MQKTLYKILGLTLSLSMFGSVAAVAASAAEAETMHYQNYTVMGDSIAAGYGTDNYFGGETEKIEDERIVEGTYADLVAQGVGAKNAISVAHSGWRTTEILRVLKDDYTLEDDTRILQDMSDFYLRALTMLPKEQFYYRDENGEWAQDENHMYLIQPSIKKHIKDSVRSADLITVQFGSNDIYSTALSTTYNKYEQILEKTGLFDINLNIQSQEDLENAFAVLLEVAKVAGQFKNLLADYFIELENGFATYKKNMPMVLEEIRKLNPDAKILIVGVANPTSITGDLPLKIWDYSELYAARINGWTSSFCKSNDCLFAKCDTIDYYGIASLDTDKLFPFDEDIKYSAVKMMHPTETGHQQMAEEILTALEEDWDATIAYTVAALEKSSDDATQTQILASLARLIG